MPLPRGWHDRGYLPHADLAGRSFSVTYRLADALPSGVVQTLREEVLGHPAAELKLRRRIEQWCDRGHGSCVLRRPEVARLIIENWRHFAGERYRLESFVVMPNHVHVLVTPAEGQALAGIVGSWKSFTAKRIAELTGMPAPIWQADYWDRFIRDESHRWRTTEYIRNNPVRAGLCGNPEDWLWSSAAGEGDGPRAGRPG